MLEESPSVAEKGIKKGIQDHKHGRHDMGTGSSEVTGVLVGW